MTTTTTNRVNEEIKWSGINEKLKREVDNNNNERLSLGYDLSFVCFFGTQGESNETRIKVANERAHQLLK